MKRFTRALIETVLALVAGCASTGAPASRADAPVSPIEPTAQAASSLR